MSSPDERQDTSEGQPPTYSQIDLPELLLPELDLTRDAGPSSSTTVTHDQCVAHLKFLAVLTDLRDHVASTSDLFGIKDPDPGIFGDNTDEAWARVKEKRWAVYTNRAAARYTTWWERCIPGSRSPPRFSDLGNKNYATIPAYYTLSIWSRDILPPLDVLMVWHAHMLNPRAFLEDCIRHGKMKFWAAGFPWHAINACIDNSTLDYDAGQRAKDVFQVKTDLPWENLIGTSDKVVHCPCCKGRVSVPWTDGAMSTLLEGLFQGWQGFADKDFRAICPKCPFTIDHESLKIAKFRRDIEACLYADRPMPGTYYNLRGVPEYVGFFDRFQNPSIFPNRFVEEAGRSILTRTSPNNSNDQALLTLKDVNDYISTLLNSYSPRKVATSESRLSRYWDNSSPFALDLVGAVIRQGTFIQKMDQIDWLHSPTVLQTMDRLIKKYHVFFTIMATNPGHMAVPTLDVDLAWHTHQLSTPSRYFAFSLHHTRYSQHGTPIFLDHDDKVDESILSDGFAWTSKMYKQLTDGQIYSECTCWYCEAIRAPDLLTLSLPFTSTYKVNRKARRAAAKLQDTTSPDLDKNPHISAHNAVRPDLSPTESGQHEGPDPRVVKFMKLRHRYERMQRRARKKHRSGANRTNRKDATTWDPPVCPMVWGYPVEVPYQAPYTCDPGVHADAYAGNPLCMSFVDGAHGNCAVGTCGGGVAAGGCVVVEVEEEEEEEEDAAAEEEVVVLVEAVVVEGVVVEGVDRRSLRVLRLL
ncbi:hypothetical protein BO94DRAFT_578164 [Aspergillus sclerotioniger CBS 115572]|uniref:Alpha-ketoglutarate-dependent sulfonate dioxygenase n=1 Tax=Aspergillus sclerotioniger CBS 115572 TaxID=1450535 RepID=A0A317VHC1_9EURO|nr:hypothetical protein BO94DRAFT_578164 [Aspergillus sclerotioniger CBS 115572]PWY73756.1 hypothetical protein BO94DRAFT_578164 [Aspergillus sclerotioniger CBS 115572]